VSTQIGGHDACVIATMGAATLSVALCWIFGNGERAARAG
jgi:hypothetical protein